MNYMDQSVACTVCGLQTSMIVTGVCQLCASRPAAKVADAIPDWRERRADYLKRYSQNRHGPESNDRFMMAEIADLRAALASRSLVADDAAELAEWRRLKDPAVLHATLLRGLPAKLPDYVFRHIAGDDGMASAAPELQGQAQPTANLHPNGFRPGKRLPCRYMKADQTCDECRGSRTCISPPRYEMVPVDASGSAQQATPPAPVTGGTAEASDARDAAWLDFVLENDLSVVGGTQVGYAVQKYMGEGEYAEITPYKPTRREAIDAALKAMAGAKS